MDQNQQTDQNQHMDQNQQTAHRAGPAHGPEPATSTQTRTSTPSQNQQPDQKQHTNQNQHRDQLDLSRSAICWCSFWRVCGPLLAAAVSEAKKALSASVHALKHVRSLYVSLSVLLSTSRTDVSVPQF